MGTSFDKSYSPKRVEVALQRESTKPWHTLEQDFLECEYRAVRDRQMQELEDEDDLLSKVPVRYVRHVAGSEPLTHVKQEPKGEAYEGICGVCPPTTDTVSIAGYLVHQRCSAGTDRDPQEA